MGRPPRISIICEHYGHLLSKDGKECVRPKCDYRTPPPLKTEMHPLSRRELDIVEHILVDGCNKTIAKRLNITDQTVKRHVSSAMVKTRTHNRTELAMYALSKGWVKVPQLDESEAD